MNKSIVIKMLVLLFLIAGFLASDISETPLTEAHSDQITVSSANLLAIPLYTQCCSVEFEGIRSSNDTLAGTPITEAADDFVVPASGWEITVVEAYGGLGENGALFNVAFWSNSNGLPGTAVCTRNGQTNSGTPGNPLISLSASCPLPAGIYWVSIQHQGSTDTGWYWQKHNTILNSPGAWRAPGNSIGCPTTWSSLNGSGACLGVTNPDRSFILYGNIIPPNLSASANCAGDNLVVTINSGDDPFNISTDTTSSPHLPLNNVATGTYVIQGPDTWGNVLVTENTGNLETLALGAFTCVNLDGSISIPNGAPGATSGSAGPYPDVKTASGFGTTIADVDFIIEGLGHTFPSDIHLLLVSPEGTAVQVMGSACNDWGGFIYDFTFDDEAAITLPNTNGCSSGNYKPGVYSSVTFPAPAPAGPYSTSLSAFDGENPNGAWKLYIFDNVPQDYGDLGGWTLNITAQTGPIPLAASADCVNQNLAVTISSGDGPFDITASAGINTPRLGVNIGTTIINGPEKWDNVTVTETTGNAQSINLGTFKCRTDERPVPLTPAHRARTTNPFPTFSWTGISGASNYRVFVFDSADIAQRTVDIRENSGGPTTVTLTTPLPNGRLFWRVRGRQNRLWSIWSVRYTLFKDPVAPISVSTPLPTIELNIRATEVESMPVQTPTLSAPPNSR